MISRMEQPPDLHRGFTQLLSQLARTQGTRLKVSCRLWGAGAPGDDAAAEQAGASAPGDALVWQEEQLALQVTLNPYIPTPPLHESPELPRHSTAITLDSSQSIGVVHEGVLRVVGMVDQAIFDEEVSFPSERRCSVACDVHGTRLTLDFRIPPRYPDALPCIAVR